MEIAAGRCAIETISRRSPQAPQDFVLGSSPEFPLDILPAPHLREVTVLCVRPPFSHIGRRRVLIAAALATTSLDSPARLYSTRGAQSLLRPSQGESAALAPIRRPFTPQHAGCRRRRAALAAPWPKTWARLLWQGSIKEPKAHPIRRRPPLGARAGDRQGHFLKREKLRTSGEGPQDPPACPLRLFASVPLAGLGRVGGVVCATTNPREGSQASLALGVPLGDHVVRSRSPTRPRQRPKAPMPDARHVVTCYLHEYSKGNQLPFAFGRLATNI